MADIVDCRNCVFFRRLEDLPLWRYYDVVSLAHHRGDNPLGYCAKREKYVTYYRGRCRLFRAKPSSGRDSTLIAFMGAGDAQVL